MEAGPTAAETAIENNEAHFNVDLAALRRYMEKAQVQPGTLLDPGVARYVVISVDPAGGGSHSKEAFIVWLVAGNHYALLTGRTASGHRRSLPFTTIPMAFVLALMRTIRDVRASLMASLGDGTGSFTMPPVLIVMETNYAYGAAVYQRGGPPSADRERGPAGRCCG